MRVDVQERLLALNHDFYERFAAQFAASRQQPQPGFARLATFLPRPCPSLLDIGAGDGRLGRFWLAAGLIEAYTGVDFSSRLLAEGDDNAGRFIARDVTRPSALQDLGQHAAVACLAMLHHVPGKARRAELVSALARQLAPAGRLLLSTWQFAANPRQRRKILPWSIIGLADNDVEPGDFLLSWRRGGNGIRYAAAIDPAATARLATAAGLKLVADFHSDGREGDLSYYSVWER